MAVYVFGERSLPSWTIGAGASGRWSGAEDGRSGVVVSEDGQFDLLARVMRVNGLVPMVGLISVATFMVIGYAVVGSGGGKRTAWAEAGLMASVRHVIGCHCGSLHGGQGRSLVPPHTH